MRTGIERLGWPGYAAFPVPHDSVLHTQTGCLHARYQGATFASKMGKKLLPHLSPLSADPFKVEPHVFLVKLVLGSPFRKRPDHVFVKEPAVVVVPRFVFLWHSRNEPKRNENCVRVTQLSPTWLGLVLYMFPITSLRENVSVGDK